MISKEDFYGFFSGSIFDHIKNSIVPYENRPNKTQVLDELYGEIKNHTYHPSPPRRYIINNKGRYVARIIPAFQPKDYCLYFFCTKNLEENLLRGRVEGTYGAWRMSKDIRQIEDEDGQVDDNELDFGYEINASSSIDPLAWREQWSDFQKKAHDFSLKDDYQFFVKLDIANFYDNISIALLGRKLYLCASSDQQPYIELLIHFLSNWNKKYEGYAAKSVGLPQDESSDASRLLANFYLQEYDKLIKDTAREVDGEYLRYADDQILFAKNENDAMYLVYKASIFLSKIGLNINTGKVKKFESKESFNQYWAFDIFRLLADPTNRDNINEGISQFLRLKNNQAGFREHSVLKKILGLDFSLIDASLRHHILGLLLDKSFVCMMDYRFMSKLYERLGDSKGDFIETLRQLTEEYPFNSFHFNLMKFYKKHKIEYNIEGMMEELENLDYTPASRELFRFLRSSSVDDSGNTEPVDDLPF